MVVIINGSDEKYPKLGGREAFAGGGGRRDGRCVSERAVVD